MHTESPKKIIGDFWWSSFAFVSIFCKFVHTLYPRTRLAGGHRNGRGKDSQTPLTKHIANKTHGLIVCNDTPKINAWLIKKWRKGWKGEYCRRVYGLMVCNDTLKNNAWLIKKCRKGWKGDYCRRVYDLIVCNDQLKNNAWLIKKCIKGWKGDYCRRVYEVLG
jgi:hypothetical protein